MVGQLQKRGHLLNALLGHFLFTLLNASFFKVLVYNIVMTRHIKVINDFLIFNQGIISCFFHREQI